MELFIVHAGAHAGCRAVARSLAGRMSDTGIESRVLDLEAIEDVDVVLAHGLIVGSHARVDTPFGGEAPSPVLEWISGLPSLAGMPVGVFCTYRFFPYLFADVTARTAEVLGRIEAALDRRGAAVVSSHAINRRHPDDQIEALIAEFRGHLVG